MRFTNIKDTTPLKRQFVLRKKKALSSFCKRNGVKLLFLHGSLAKNRHGRLSDVDLAVFGQKLLLKDYVRMEKGFAKIIGREDIDLSDLSQGSSVLAMQVLTKGIPLHVSNRRTLSRFRYETFRRYLDGQFFRSRFADYVTRAIS